MLKELLIPIAQDVLFEALTPRVVLSPSRDLGTVVRNHVFGTMLEHQSTLGAGQIVVNSDTSVRVASCTLGHLLGQG